ncbi:MAG: hypothetical protein C6I00_02650 [Nitratiruptor sp.]|nr:hypothetical protein [Nitratiruptor sp.]NPA82849.1 protein BatD [Campylobacterota bacterium]
MRILGSWILLFWALWLHGGTLKVYLKENPIALGEPAQLVIEASGDEVELPTIKRIAGYPVAGRSRSESVIERGGEFIVQKIEVLTFYPDRNVTIQPIAVQIDGQIHKSEPIELGVKRRIKRDEYVHFSLQASKREAFVGEPILLEMVLKLRRGLNIINYDFIPPKFDGFWVKELEGSNKYLEEHGEYLIKRMRFLLLPQRPGALKVAPALFKYATPQRSTDLFGFSITAPKWHSVLSNEITIIAKPLPKDLDLVGDFQLRLEVDKREVDPNEPVNVTLTIEGPGNLENFSGIKLSIPNALVYEDRPQTKLSLQGSTIHSTFTQHFSIIADANFTIPAISLEYFSLKEENLKELKSDPIPIHVRGSAPPPPPPSQSHPSPPPTSSTSSSSSSSHFWPPFLLGFGSALALVALFWLGRRVGRWKVKGAGGKRELLRRLLPHVGHDPEAARMAEALYEELYEGKGKRVSKREVVRLLEDLVERRRPGHPGP